MLQHRLAPALSGQRYRPFTYLLEQDVDISTNGIVSTRSSIIVNIHQPVFTIIPTTSPQSSTTNAPSNQPTQRNNARNGPPLPTPNLPLLHHRRRLPLPLIITHLYFPEQSTAHSLTVEEQQYPRTRLVKREYTKRRGERPRENQSE